MRWNPARHDAHGGMRRSDSANVALGFDLGETEQSIPDRFAKVVTRFPDRAAVRAHDMSLSFGQLDAASNDVAQRILAVRGEAPEPVCLLIDQGVDLVTAILGTLKAGKMYLALDPRRSAAELKHFVEHSGAELIVCDAPNQRLADELATEPRAVMTLDAAHPGSPGPGPRLRLSPERPAYIFYTSGSTGLPKGVFDSHRNVLHNVMRYTKTLDIRPLDRLSMIQSCSFSGTVSSLFGALLNGASVHPFDLHGKGVDAMAKWLAREEITIYHSVPTIFEQLAAVAPPLPKLRLIRLEGDRTEPRHLLRFQEIFGPDVALVNGLGATETGIVRQFFVHHGDAVPEAVVPIGHAVPDMSIRLLDEQGCDVEPGEVGEIAVVSRYLALGYWRQQDRTAEAFRPDPQDPELRIYRTRDIGRLLPDGCLEYLGRKDFQNKLRGISIDLPAIEAALNRQPVVDRALVTVREDRPGAQRLVAYFTTDDARQVNVSDLRRALAKSMPDAMIPSRYAILKAFPLDKNGKVDRRALPAPGQERPELDTPFVAPETTRQKMIAACFAEVLGLDEVGLNDNFFELGGDSLLATELLFLIDDRLDILCPSDFLYTAPTIAEIERTIDAAPEAGDIVPLMPGGSRASLFCLHSTSGHVLEYRQLANLIGSDHPVFGVQRRDLMTTRRGSLPRLDDMATSAVAAILRVQPEGPYHLCGNCFGGLLALEVARQLRAAEREVELVALLDTRFPSSMRSAISPRRATGVFLAEALRLPVGEMADNILARLRNYVGRVRRKATKATRLVAARIAGADSNTGGGAAVRAPFRPSPYDGPVVLFVPGEPDDRRYWQAVLPQLQVVQIGDGIVTARRPHLVSDPHVRELANTLRQLMGN